MTANAALADFDQLVDRLRRDHQGFYQYRPREDIDRELGQLRASIDDGIEPHEFLRIVHRVVALTDEGHAGVIPSERTLNDYGSREGFFPLTLVFAGATALPGSIVADGRSPVDARERIVAIDGEPIAYVMHDILDLVATDGYNETAAYVSAGERFPDFYLLARGLRDRFELELERFGTGERRTVTLQAVAGERLFGEEPVVLNAPLDPPDFHYEALGCGVGYLSVSGFDERDDYEAWYADVFARVRADDTRALVLDISENGGGVEGNENLLASYLLPAPFRKYRWVSVTKGIFEMADDVDEEWTLVGERAYRAPHTLRSDYYGEFDYASPDPSLVFDGPLIVITSGYTFSGGAEFASLLRMRERAEFVGQEVGGANEGNVSGSRFDIVLENSGITVPMPLIHYRMDVDPTTRGRGVMPDHPVTPTWSALLEGRNAPLETALALARERAGSTNDCDVRQPG